jgi:hypothetical protein
MQCKHTETIKKTFDKAESKTQSPDTCWCIVHCHDLTNSTLIPPHGNGMHYVDVIADRAGTRFAVGRVHESCFETAGSARTRVIPLTRNTASPGAAFRYRQFCVWTAQPYVEVRNSHNRLAADDPAGCASRPRIWGFGPDSRDCWPAPSSSVQMRCAPPRRVRRPSSAIRMRCASSSTSASSTCRLSWS